MNPAQERVARNLVVNVKKMLKDAQATSGTALTSGSGNLSLGQAIVSLSPAYVSSKAKRARVKRSVNLTGEKGKGKYDLPPAG